MHSPCAGRFLALLLFGFLLTLQTALAQHQGQVYVEDSSIRVVSGTKHRQLAWAGGFNSPQVSMADLNRDGLADLVTFERSTRQIKTFINTGAPGQPNYVYMPRYADNFPQQWDSGVYDYMILADYNRDSIMDIFHKGCCGFVAWRGYYNANNELAFRFYGVLQSYSPIFGNVAAYSQTSDIPGIGDVDGDGDLDFMAYNVIGKNILFYKNCQVEQGLPKDTIKLCYNESCWGSTFQYFDRAFALGVTGCDTTGLTGCKTTMHAGNTMCLLDMDGDGDLDLLDGNISFNDIQYLKNGRTEFHRNRDTIIAQDTTWPSAGHKVNMPTWPAAFWVDVDADGAKDIVITPHADGGSENFKTIAWYRNAGSNSAPNFVYQHDSLLVEHSLDFGTASYPAVYDYNRDGRPDLFVGSDGYYTNGVNRSRLSYFQNVLLNGRTTLVLVSSDFLGTGSQNFEGTAPAFGDLDNDGKDDMVLGHVDGSLSFYKNSAASGTAQPVWTLNQLQLRNHLNASINVGYNATPCIYDIDRDGKKDLIIGHQGGSLFYYKNTGGSNQLRLQKMSDTLGGVKANPANPYSGFSAPFVGRVDNTGSEYLLVGNDLGNIRRFTGFQTGDVTASFVATDNAYSNLDAGTRMAPAVADFDGDGKFELVGGNLLGGLHLYRQVRNVSVAGGAGGSTGGGIRLFPNPAGESISLEWEGPLASEARCLIVDAMGRAVAETVIAVGSVATTVDIHSLAPGMYHCIVSGPALRSVQKFTVVR